MEEIQNITTRNTQTGEIKNFKDLQQFKDFFDDYSTILNSYNVFSKQKGEESFLKAFDFNWNCFRCNNWAMIDYKVVAEKTQRNRNVGNGEGSLYYSKTLKKWVYQYFVNDERKTIKQKKNESVKDFKARVTDIKSKLDNGNYIEKCKDTFSDILQAHIDQKHIDGITSERSYLRELLTLKQIELTCSTFYNKPIQKITVDDIQKSKVNIRKYSNEVITKIWGAIKKTFQIALSRRMIYFNIMEDETLTKPISIKIPRTITALTVNEEKHFVSILNNEELNHKYRNILLLQLYTGMRIGEVLALSKDCINLKDNTITIYRTLTQDKHGNVILGEHTKTYDKKTGIDRGKRTFPMTNNVRNLILNIFNNKISSSNGLLFWDYEDNTFVTPKEINCFLKRLNEKYNICEESLHTHRLRHTFITRCREIHMDELVVQAIAGHVPNSDSTRGYTTISLDYIKEECQKIQA